MIRQGSNPADWRLIFQWPFILAVAVVLQAGNVVAGDLLGLWHADSTCDAGCTGFGCDDDPLDSSCCDGGSCHSGSCLDFEGCFGSRFKLTELI